MMANTDTEYLLHFELSKTQTKYIKRVKNIDLYHEHIFRVQGNIPSIGAYVEYPINGLQVLVRIDRVHHQIVIKEGRDNDDSYEEKSVLCYGHVPHELMRD